jgi:hypothetical protein
MLILVGAYTLSRRTLGMGAKAAGKRYEKAGIALLAGTVGFYDGFFGPGAGSFLMFGLIRLFDYDFLGAAAATKVLNLATNLGALALFAATGNVLYAVAFPMAACNIAGGLLGAQVAVTKGNRLVRVVFLLVLTALVTRLTYDLVKTD